jgi:hypothetical protein
MHSQRRKEVRSMTIPDFTDYVERENGPRTLPTYKGYTIDVRCRQFRKIEWGKLPEFHSFRSELGDTLLCELLHVLPDGLTLKDELMEAAVHDDWWTD